MFYRNPIFHYLLQLIFIFSNANKTEIIVLFQPRKKYFILLIDIWNFRLINNNTSNSNTEDKDTATSPTSTNTANSTVQISSSTLRFSSSRTLLTEIAS